MALRCSTRGPSCRRFWSLLSFRESCRQRAELRGRHCKYFPNHVKQSEGNEPVKCNRACGSGREKPEPGGTCGRSRGCRDKVLLAPDFCWHLPPGFLQLEASCPQPSSEGDSPGDAIPPPKDSLETQSPCLGTCCPHSPQPKPLHPWPDWCPTELGTKRRDSPWLTGQHLSTRTDFGAAACPGDLHPSPRRALSGRGEAEPWFVISRLLLQPLNFTPTHLIIRTFIC